MQILIRSIDTLNEWVGKIASILMIPLVLIAAYEVVMRYVFNSPTIWAWDLNIQIFAAIIMFGGGYTFLHDGHVRVDVLTIHLSEKAKDVLDILTPIFLFVGTSALIVLGWDMAWMSFQIKETVATVWAPPYYIMKMFVPVGAFLLFLQGISDLLKKLIKIFGSSDQE